VQHENPNRWCYVSPENPTEHVPLGYEEICLWARKIVPVSQKNYSHGHRDKHDNEADADCLVPPNCLSLNNYFHHKASHVRQVNSKSAIHIHVNNNPLGDSSHHNILGASHPTHGFKRLRSITSENSTDSDDSDEEPLALADVLETLNQKYPQINLPQYMPILEQEKIVYAETVLEFDKDYLVGLGIPEGETRSLLKGVEKVVGRRKKEKKEKKRIQVSQREESL
jgi:hypothetical protein